MELLHLPHEVIESILVESIVIRGVKRGVRLKLVCKRFNELFRLALYRSHTLDSFAAPRVGFRWWMRNDRYGSIKLWHGYLSYRVREEKDREVGRFVELREIAEAWRGLNAYNSSSPEIIDGICWLALERGTNRPGERSQWIKKGNYDWRSFNIVERMEYKKNPSNMEHRLLCVAAYFNEVCVASKLLQQYGDLCSLADECNLFPSPIEIAAFRGHIPILDLFQSHIINKASPQLSDDNSYIVWAYRNMKGGIKGALINGNLKLLIRVLFPPSIRPCQPTTLRHVKVDLSGSGRELITLQQFCRTPDAYDAINHLLPLPEVFETAKIRLHWISRSQARYSQSGQLEMLRHLLRLNSGLFPTTDGKIYNPLTLASRACFEDVVEFLLSHGIEEDEDVLLDAARGGSLNIMRRLLNHGIQFPPRWPQNTNHVLLAEVVYAENTAMLELILERGYTISEAKRQFVIREASKRGLESMVVLLKDIETHEEDSSGDESDGSEWQGLKD